MRMFEVIARIGFIGAMRDTGCNLSNREVEEVVRTEAACLAENGRICFGEGASALLIRAFSDSAYFTGNVANTLMDLVESFYEMRDDLPAQVTDQEIVEALRDCFDGEAAGDVGLALSLSKDSLSSCEGIRAYGIADEDGLLYRWDPDEWLDNVKTDGWYGERWGEDCD